MYFIFLPRMIKHLNRHKRLISSIFLLGYFSFIILTITHVHGDTLNNTYKTIGIACTHLSSTSSDSQDNCQICHLFSSININTNGTTLHSVLLIETCTLLNIDPKYKSNPVDVNYLRGPPSENILST
jgi:hypothetical protein